MRDTSALKPVLARYGLSLCALGAFLAVALVRWVYPPVYLHLSGLSDGVFKPTPFVDLLDILQAGACWRAGVDVYVPSLCLFGGVFNYSPFMLRAAYLPIGPGDTMVGGMLQSLLFFWSLSWLPKPATKAEFFFLLACVFSVPVIYALEQGNFDTVVFVLAALGIRQSLKPGLRSLLGTGIFIFAAALKFYPVALVLLILRQPLRRLLPIALLGLAAGGLFLGFFAHDVLTALRILPSGTPFRATFGRIDLPRGLNLLHLLTVRNANHLLGHAVFSSGAALVTLVSWLLSAAALTASGLTARRYAGAVKSLPPERLAFLIGGAAVTVFCFYAAQNVYYRAIFLLFTLPGLRQLAHGPDAGRARWLLAVIFLLLWEAIPRDLLAASGHALGFWLLREILWWWLVVQFGALILAFVRHEVLRLIRAAHTQN